MNHQEGGSPERRRHVRIAPKGTVMLTVLGLTQRGRIADLAEGGIFVLTPASAPEGWLGRSVEIVISGPPGG